MRIERAAASRLEVGQEGGGHGHGEAGEHLGAAVKQARDGEVDGHDGRGRQHARQAGGAPALRPHQQRAQHRAPEQPHLHACRAAG